MSPSTKNNSASLKQFFPLKQSVTAFVWDWLFWQYTIGLTSLIISRSFRDGCVCRVHASRFQRLTPVLYIRHWHLPDLIYGKPLSKCHITRYECHAISQCVCRSVVIVRRKQKLQWKFTVVIYLFIHQVIACCIILIEILSKQTFKEEKHTTNDVSDSCFHRHQFVCILDATDSSCRPASPCLSVKYLCSEYHRQVLWPVVSRLFFLFSAIIFWINDYSYVGRMGLFWKCPCIISSI